MKEYIKLMRPKHYIKNLLIFLPLIFSQQLTNLLVLKKSILAFISFSLIASVVYIINDIKDAKSDREHPIKKNRPIASGKIKISSAYIFAFVLFFISMCISYYISTKATMYYTYSLLLMYLIINILYSFALKNVPIIDILILASGFLIRILYGAAIINVEVSNWLYFTILFGAFYLGYGKRRNEINKNGIKSRKVLKYYGRDFLDKNMYLCLTLSIVFYSLWCTDNNTIQKLGNNYLIWTVILIMLIFMKYSLDIENDSFADPVDVITSDKMLLFLIIIYIIIMLCIIYIL